MRLLLDEMYPASLALALRDVGIDACTAAELGLAGWSDPDLFATAAADGFAVLTENVCDFARISADRLTAGRHQPGLLIAQSSRFSRGPSGTGRLVAAIRLVAGERLDDRVIYLDV